MNIGGDEAEDAASFTIDEQHFKQAVKEYAQLKDTFGIDRQSSTLDECLDEFTQHKLLYTLIT